jgi:DNA helicase-2/ATP-dependent DNA helicase PcrA
MAFDYLKGLNTEQRRAVEYGVNAGEANNFGPLLVIAGAGSGKTKTLAHRAAHLVVNGVDPQRILLLTFSRRAAEEMIRRVERITRAALGAGDIDLSWAGTFHAVGARLLREFANPVGLKPSFTILDRVGCR